MASSISTGCPSPKRSGSPADRLAARLNLAPVAAPWHTNRLAVTAVGAVLNMHYVLLEIAVPLWVDRYTSAPRWTVALLFLLNTACCVLLQVRMSRSAHDVPSSARTQNASSLLVRTLPT